MTEETTPGERAHWHLDRRIPVATLVVLIVQAIGFSAWIGAQSAATEARLSELERDRSAISANLAALRVDARLSVLENQTQQVLKSLERVEDRLEADRP